MRTIRFVSITTMSEVFDVDRRTIYRWRQEGKLPPPDKTWGSPRWDWDKVQEAIRNRDNSGHSET